MLKPIIHTLDLNFLGIPKTIGVYLIPHSNGGILIECGPGSTLPQLIQNLTEYNLEPEDITDVLLTHIHLDHAGSAGWWARQGATIHMHEVGTSHMVRPEKLISSASRIYGDLMEQLWGEFLPVPEEKIHSLKDGDEIIIDEWTIRALDTPGHANHHMSYILDGVCFSGDVGGVHIKGVKAVRLPTVPPEFHIEKWRQSINRFRQENIHTFATTHFGIHEDAIWHLDAIEKTLEEINSWMETIMPTNPTKEQFREYFCEWTQQKSAEDNLTTEIIGALDVAISSQMSADGIFRYWQKTKGR